MKTATVIQDSLRFLGGGELVCLSTCFALQELGYHVRLVSDRFRPDEVETVFGMGDVLANCEQIKLPEFGRNLLRFRPIRGLYHAERSRRFLEKQDADVVFVTRDPSRPRVLPEKPLFRFVYEVAQLRPFWENYRFGLNLLWRALYGRDRSDTTFLALSPAVMREVKMKGHPAVAQVYPSYGKGFRPKPKKNQLIYVTFFAPQKRLHDFMEIARQLPKYKFYLVGRDTKRMNQTYEGYAERILANKPTNVEYVEARIRQAPNLLEESRIYLHTSIEPGMGIAVMEALSAGCVPIAPRQGGAGEVLEAAGVGFHYDQIEDAIRLIRSEMGDDARGKQEGVREMSPGEISEKARIFSLEAFRTRIRDIIEKRVAATGHEPSDSPD